MRGSEQPKKKGLIYKNWKYVFVNSFDNMRSSDNINHFYNFMEFNNLKNINRF